MVTEPNVGPCWTLTEEGGPFFETTLVPEGDHYILNGSKTFVTNGGSPLTKYYVVMAKEEGVAPEMSTRGCFIPADTPGLNYIKNENKMGQRLSQNAQMFLDNVRVPKEHVFDVSAISVEESMARTADQERLTTIHTWVTLGALCLGLSRSAYEEALKYAKTRKIAGKPAISYQLVGAKLADMYWSIESLRAFIWKVANHFDHNPMDHKLAWGCKVMGSDTAVKVTSEALQIHGGYGYSKESLVEKLYRDAKVTQIYECPNELLRVATANMLAFGL
jgi:alkylation response protein AidB-like acyl-CoA dehydrogenase